MAWMALIARTRRRLVAAPLVRHAKPVLWSSSSLKEPTSWWNAAHVLIEVPVAHEDNNIDRERRTCSSNGRGHVGTAVARRHGFCTLPFEQQHQLQRRRRRLSAQGSAQQTAKSTTTLSLRSRPQMEGWSWWFATATTTAADATASAATTASSTTVPLSSDPLWHFFLETVISYTVPSVIICSSIGATAWMVSRAASRRRAHDKKPTSQHLQLKEKRRSGTPAAELYDDLYYDKPSKSNVSPLQEIFQLLRESSSQLGTGKKKSHVRRLNRGMPVDEYISIKHWNQILDSYQYSMTAATDSRVKAAAQLRSKNFDRALTRAFQGPTMSLQQQLSTAIPATKRHLLALEQDFLKQGTHVLHDIQSLQTKLTRHVIDEEMQAMGVMTFEMDPVISETQREEDNSKGDTAKILDLAEKDTSATINSTNSSNEDKNPQTKKKAFDNKEMKEWMTKLTEHQKELMQLELDFVKDVVATMGVERASGIRVALLGDIAARGSGGLLTQLQQRPLTAILEALQQSTLPSPLLADSAEVDNDEINDGTSKGNDIATGSGNAGDASNQDSLDADVVSDTTDKVPRRGCVFVTRFPGDTTASRVAKFREEVTAMLLAARPGVDEVLVVLESGGGTVTGYGLAAGQMQRLKDHGLRITVAVEQVAASGGYMMCCMADRIVGSPFAVFGSIGVLTEIPNVYNRLKREGVEFQTVTAGKYKRTLTPFKEVNDEDFEKTKEQVEGILALFKRFVEQNRPKLAAVMEEKIATGEVWFGTDAVDVGLCDEIKTVDQLLGEYVGAGKEVYEIEYKPPKRGRNRLVRVLPVDEELEEEGDGIVARGVHWFLRLVAAEAREMVASEFQRQHPHNGRFPEETYMTRYDGADRVRMHWDENRGENR